MRYRVWFGMVAAGALAAPSAASAAQEQERDEVRELRLESGPDRLMRVMLDRRARLGVKVNLQKRETDSIGAYVEAVTPGGPAATAGIRSGDVITKVDGKSVLSGGAAEDRAGSQSPPGLRLIELVARLEPGDSVPVEYRRGKERRTVTVVTQEEPEFVLEGGPPGRQFGFRFFRPDAPDIRVPAGDFVERFDPPLAYREFVSGSPLARLELAPMNSELGQYFGLSEGVLVVSSPDSALGLRGGDVVLAVDGRKPTGPAHLLRILRSYESGESFELDIQRNRKRETVTARLGDRDREGDR